VDNFDASILLSVIELRWKLAFVGVESLRKRVEAVSVLVLGRLLVRVIAIVATRAYSIASVASHG